MKSQDIVRVVLLVIAALIAVKLVLWILSAAVFFAFKIVLPLALLAGIGYVAYTMFSGKALLGGRRTLP